MAKKKKLHQAATLPPTPDEPPIKALDSPTVSSPERAPAQGIPIQNVDFTKATDFISRYCSNVQFDNSIWGLRVIFGELQTVKGRPIVEQHTAITMPWAQAKMLLAFLDVNLSAHEIAYGRIDLPDYLLPPVPPEPPVEIQSNPEQMAKAKSFQKLVQAIRDRLTKEPNS